MKVLAISDLHIQNDSDPLFTDLLRLLQERVSTEDTVLLVGDVFDLYIGDKVFYRKMYSRFFDALEDLSKKGVRIHYFEGNHDFHLKTALQRIPRVSLHVESASFDFSGKRFFVSHGDLADPEDRGYLFMRSVLRSLPLKAAIALAPSRVVHFIGEWMNRHLSAAGDLMETASPEVLKRTRSIFHDYAEKQIRAGHDFVILGHCHDLDAKDFNIDGRKGKYMNIGFPRVHRSYLLWDGQDLERIFF